MRVVEIVEEHRDEDIKRARKIIRQEVGHPSKTVMIIRGKSPAIGQFADRAAVRSNVFPWREVVWVRDDDILTQEQVDKWFNRKLQYCAVVLDFSDKPVAHLAADATLLQIEKAFLNA